MDKLHSRKFDFFIRLLVLVKFHALWFIVLITFPLFLLGSGLIMPVREQQSTSQICTICGATQRLWTISMWRLPVCRHTTFYHREEIKDLYNVIVGANHEHEWCSGYEELKVGNLFAWNKTQRSISEDEKYPLYQPRLTNIALSMGIHLRYSDAEFRKELSHEIINSRSVEEYYDLCRVYNNPKARKMSTARDIWKAWLNKRQLGTEPEISGNRIPEWATSSILHLPSVVEVPDEMNKIQSDYSRSWFFW